MHATKKYIGLNATHPRYCSRCIFCTLAASHLTYPGPEVLSPENANDVKLLLSVHVSLHQTLLACLLAALHVSFFAIQSSDSDISLAHSLVNHQDRFTPDM